MNFPHVVLRKAGSTRRFGRGTAMAAGTGLLALTVAGGTLVASAGGASAEEQATTSVVGADGAKAISALKKWGPRVEHAEAVVKTKSGDRSVLVQRGKITMIGANAMTVRSADGFDVVWKVGDATHVRADGSKSSVSTLKAGDQVAVAGGGDGHTGNARIVRDKG
jgi:hypothetical protein